MVNKTLIFLVFSLFYSDLVLAGCYYPTDIFQVVHVVHQGPVEFIEVESEFAGSQFVLGYKNNGYLANSGDSIDAVLISRCADGNQDNSQNLKISHLTLGKEWHGTGYMSGPFTMWSYILSNPCEFQKDDWNIEVAFVDRNGKWDSRNGNNYHFSKEEFRNNKAIHYDTRQGPDQGFFDINLKAWNFIIDQMRN